MENVEILLTDPKTVKALAHPIRTRLLAMLDRHEMSPSEIAGEIGKPLGTVSYHVRTLHEMGLLRLVREEPRRGTVEHYYTGVKWYIPDHVWKELPEALKGTVHQSFLSQIGEDISSAAVTGGFDKPYSLLNRDVLTLDDVGSLQLAKEISRLAQRALAIEAESTERLEDSGLDRREKVHFVTMLFGVLEVPQRRDGQG